MTSAIAKCATIAATSAVHATVDIAAASAVHVVAVVSVVLAVSVASAVHAVAVASVVLAVADLTVAVSVHMVVPTAVVLTDIVVVQEWADIVNSEFQHPHLSIHHALHFAHWFLIIYCLDGLVDNPMAYSQHLLSWIGISDISDELACPGKKVF